MVEISQSIFTLEEDLAKAASLFDNTFPFLFYFISFCLFFLISYFFFFLLKHTFLSATKNSTMYMCYNL